MPHRFFVALVAALVLTALAVQPADARRKKAKPYRAQSSSLDGRVTGQPRTCGYDHFIYDWHGVPVGPYCH